MDRRWVATWCVVAGCNLGKTDIGDLETDGSSGDTSGASTDDSTSVESSSTSPVDCSGEDCTDGCCDGFGCNFKNICVACSAEGEYLDIDGAGCCDGLVAGPVEICYAPTCTDEGCPPGTAACVSLSELNLGGQYALDCPQEACLGSRTLVVSNDAGTPGLECAGSDGSEFCMASGEKGLQQYSYDDGNGLSFTLGFDPAVLADYSTDGFNTHYEGIGGQITIPDASVPIVAFIGDITEITPFVYSDGRLQFTLTLMLDNPFTQIESDAEDCLTDDIAGICACYYEGLGEYEIVVDLEIEAP